MTQTIYDRQNEETRGQRRGSTQNATWKGDEWKKLVTHQISWANVEGRGADAIGCELHHKKIADIR